ncbi:MAG: hypothetical protein JWO32_520 [Bacteroidetes bacterium]|nr:hypothetical protein [Bacteroidota bacterium]
MRNLNASLLALSFLFLSQSFFSQNPPNLGAASGFALFTAVGAFDNVGAGTTVTGDIGTDAGAFTGFPPGTLIGTSHVADAVSSQAATDVNTAYNYLNSLTCGPVLGVTLGNGQILTPDVYCIGAAATLTGSLVLNGQGNANSLFIIKINGALSTVSSSSVVLINGASLCNVYWQINGKVSLGTNSFFKGTIVANGAIELLSGANLTGRGLSAAGAISLLDNTVSIGQAPVASTISAGGSIIFCEGGTVVLSGNNSGTWNTGALTPSLTTNVGGTYYVTNTNGCGSSTSNSITVTVNPSPHVDLGADTTVCGCIILNAASSGATYQWNNGDDYSTVNVCTSGNYWVNVSNGICMTSDTIHLTVSQPPVVTISVTPGIPVVLNAGNSGSSFIWNTGATTQTIIAFVSGIYSVTVRNQFGCTGTDTSDVTINEAAGLVKPLQIVPNPTNDKTFSLNFNVNNYSNVEVRITSSLGVLVYEEKLENFKGLYAKKVGLENLTEGVYCAEVLSEGKSRIIKIILY